MTKPLIIARYDSRNFQFEGVGSTESQAVDVCAQGLRAHALQMGLVLDWWWVDLSPATEAEALKPESGLWGIHTYEVGEAYRDGEALPAMAADAAKAEREAMTANAGRMLYKGDAEARIVNITNDHFGVALKGRRGVLSGATVEAVREEAARYGWHPREEN